MKRMAFIWCLVLLTLSSQTIQSKEKPRVNKLAVSEKVKFAARQFDLERIRLLPGPLKDLLDRNRRYLLSLDVDRLVHNFRVNAGIPSKSEPLGGWEAPDCELRGHFTGHYLSACALMYAATGDENVKTRAMKVVKSLEECQRSLGVSGYLSAFPEEFIDRVENGKRVWAPYYTLHKIMAGLFDMYSICGDDNALRVLRHMAGWIKYRTDKLDEKQIQAMLKTEFGGMTEVLSNLYAVTADSGDFVLARRFEKRAFLDPLIAQRDELKGLHVNTHIPQVIGAAREFELTGDTACFMAASYFWNEVVGARSYATGGTSNYEYWREAPHHLSDELSQESHENCCTYNMLKLTDHLFSWSADARYAEYYERALFSAILPTYHPTVGGAIMYYVPLKSGLFKSFGIPDSSYFCCNGSGIESFSKLGCSIYFQATDGVFVSLFIPSELRWTEKGAVIRQETKFPESESSSITISLRAPTEFSLYIRKPSWTADRFEIDVNGMPASDLAFDKGFARVRRTWKNGDVVKIRLSMKLRLERLEDNPHVAAILYGPVVLAGELGTVGMTDDMRNGLALPDVDRMVSQGAASQAPSLVLASQDLNASIKPVAGKPLTFRTVGTGIPADVTLIPFYRLFGQRYAVYWNVYSTKEWKIRAASLPSLPAGIIDRVVIGDIQSDRDHNFQAWRSERGELDGKKWVRSQISFRYDLDVDGSKPLTLECLFAGGGKDCAFDILADGVRIASDAIGASESVRKTYDIPSAVVQNNQRIAVTFRAKENKPTAQLFECAIVAGSR
ncbi:MAG TPA: beta-L-arabinofuranosidase domain-containing protein [Bacteroidota bacterium]|nr:beta-L-arabinofuranosidase domain-containing protein [Bacteroidota bacterium]